MVVSVVTRLYSVAVNSTLITAPSVYLRIATLSENVWVFHSLANGVSWDFVRRFHLPSNGMPCTWAS